MTATLTPHTPGCSNCHCLMCFRRRKAYRIERDHGLRRLIPVRASREHLVELTATMGWRALARATGLSEPTLVRVCNGSGRFVLRDTEQRILAVRPAPVVLRVDLVDSTATRLRVQALVRLGYTQADLVREMGCSGGNGVRLGERVTCRRAELVLGLCGQIRDTPGPDRRAASRAESRGWRPPADFDENLFYDPTWDGTESPLESLSAREEYLREYDFLRATGATVGSIAERLHITRGYLLLLLAQRDGLEMTG